MALDVGALVGHLQIDDTQFDRGLKTGEAKFRAMGHKLVTAAKAAGIALALGLVTQIPAMISSASHLAETQSKVNHVFGEGAAAVTAFADTAADQFGISKQAALDAVATFGILAKGAGLTGNRAAEFGVGMSKLATDLASFHDTSADQAIEAIGAALRGESEPIRAFGVLLDDATVKAEAMRMGLIKTTSDALTPQQRVLATQAAILKQTGDAQGDFARTSDGLAGKQKKLAANFEDTKAELGEGLLPVATDFVGILSETVKWIKDNHDWLVPLVGVLAGLGGIIWLVVQAIKVWTTVQWLLNIALDANPIGLIILAIVALVAGIILLWNHSAAFRDFFIGMWDAIWGFLKAVGRWFAGPFANFFVNLWDGIVDGVQDTFNKVVGFVTGLPGKIRGAAKGMWDGITHGFKAAINWLIDKWNSLDLGVTVQLPSWMGGFGFTIPDLFPDIPRLAEGGFLPATPGGRLAVLAEGGQDEFALPDSRLRALLVEAAAMGGRRRDDDSGDVHHVYVVIDGQQLEGRIVRVVRERDRRTKRRVVAGAGAR